jgi:hypothetical protein
MGPQVVVGDHAKSDWRKLNDLSVLEALFVAKRRLDV